MRISLKLSVVTACAVGALLMGFSYLITQREIELVAADLRRDHRMLGHALALSASIAAERSGTNGALDLIAEVNHRKSGIEIGWHPDASALPTLGDSTGLVQVHDRSGKYLVTRVGMALGQPGYLELRESTRENDQYIRGSIIRSIWATLLVTLFGALIIFTLGFWVLGKPMKLVVANARRIGGGDLESRLSLAQDDEMGELAREMNSMCERLRNAESAARREAAGRIAALEQLRHADRLTTVGKLASGIAHELGTPLNVAAARARMIVTGESQGQKALRDATIIVEQAERMRRIIQQLLDFARQRRPSKAPHDLAGIVRNTLELLEAMAARQQVALRWAGDEAPVCALVDSAQIQQVVINLVVNAIQSQPCGGEVRVGLYPNAAASPPCVTLEVDDDGQGMTVDVVQRMFEPFFTTKDVGQGTGLGLAVVYGIVEEHGGTYQRGFGATTRDPRSRLPTDR